MRSAKLTDKPMRIAVVGSTYARFDEDHQVPWLRETVNRLAARGHDVTVIAPSFKGLASHKIDGITVKRFRYGPAGLESLTHDEGAPNKAKSLTYKLLGATYVLSGIVSTFFWALFRKFDVIQIHWPFPHGLFGILPSRILGIPVVATCHGAELAMGRNSKKIAKILRFCLKSADAITCNSSHTRDEIRKLSDCQAEVIPYGSTVRNDQAEIEPACAHGPDKTATLLFSGRLIQRKGVGYLIQALPAILAQRPVKLFITGEGPCKAEWEELTGKMGLQDSVEFLGFVSNEKLGELYRTVDLYVHPAVHDDRGDTEGLGVVLIEGLINQRPIVASGVGGIVDVIKHEQTGLLVEEKDPAALSTAILRLLNDGAYARLLASQGRDFALRFFDWDLITLDLEALLASACHRQKPLVQTAPATIAQH